MSNTLWTAVDMYFTNALIPPDPVMDEVLKASDVAGLPPHHVAPNQGKLLMLLAMIHGAKRILEIGTLAGYSTIWLARALPPDGKLVTLEAQPTHANVARANLVRAGVIDRVDLRVGLASESLSTLAREGAAPFDLIFVDADKPNNPNYFAWALKLSRPGTVIIFDNVVRDGAVVDSTSEDPNVQGIRQLNTLLASEPRVTATAIQTVGSKGYDGFAIAIVQ